MVNWCERCGKEVETKIISKRETYPVHGEKITVNTKVMICAECGEEIFNEELDSKTLTKVFEKYKRRKK